MKLKAMTIRYTDEQEKAIIAMAEKMGKTTMSKAFLSAPALIEAQHNKILELSKMTEKQAERISTLQEIINQWTDLNMRLEKFVRRKT
jgi:hypothetical protein